MILGVRESIFQLYVVGGVTTHQTGIALSDLQTDVLMWVPPNPPTISFRGTDKYFSVIYVNPFHH